MTMLHIYLSRGGTGFQQFRISKALALMDVIGLTTNGLKNSNKQYYATPPTYFHVDAYVLYGF
jgi:hypothetical protein